MLDMANINDAVVAIVLTKMVLEEEVVEVVLVVAVVV